MNPFVRIVLGACVLVVTGIAAGADIQLPAFEKHTLKNGAVVLLMEKHDTPLVALNISLRGGGLSDPPGKEGSAALLGELIQKGAGKRDAKAYAEAIDAAGGQIAYAGGVSRFALRGEFLAADLGLMIELMSDAILRPTLDANEFDKLRERAVQSLIAAKDGDPSGLIGSYGDAWLFGDHPYGRPSGGSEASLAAITRDDLLAFQRDQLGADRAIIVAVGDFQAERLLKQLEDAFGGWAKAKTAPPQVAAQPRASGRRVLLVDKPGATQTYFWFGNVGASATDPDRVAQELLNTLFGGRFTSMLNSELRVRTGLTYGAGANFDRLAQPGAFYVSSFTKTESTVEAIDLALATLEKLHAEGVSDAALQSARNYTLGQFPPTIETNGALAEQLVLLELFGLGRDEIDQLTQRVNAADQGAAKRALAAFPRAADLAMVLIGDAAKIRESVKKYGPITEMKLADPSFRTSVSPQ